jgi:hypothetical protein
VAGKGINTDALTVEKLQSVLAAFQPVFAPKDLEFLQFRGEPYFIGYRPPAPYNFADEIEPMPNRSNLYENI